MDASRRASCVIVLGMLLGSGCAQTQLTTLESQNRALTEQNRAQLAEIQNLKIHSRKVEDQLIAAEKDLALLDGRRLSGRGMPPGLSGRLAELASRYPSLQYDPATGISKLDTDVLFDSGDAELKPGAEEILREIAEVFNSPEARDLKLMVVGHADAQGIKGRELRARYPSNWHLSAGRALAVADWMRGAGIPEARMGVAGFGQYQPISPNDTAAARSLNRRVEIYVLDPQTPLVGWADTAGHFVR